MIVDDNHDAANSLARCMKMLGHLVQVAYDGPTGIELANQFRPEVVLLDIGLGDMSGFDVCRSIRQSLRGDLMAAFTITGCDADETSSGAAEVGFDMHFVKPIKIDTLEDAIKCLLRPIDQV